jgi:hypothetical protein
MSAKVGWAIHRSNVHANLKWYAKSLPAEALGPGSSETSEAISFSPAR